MIASRHEVKTSTTFSSSLLRQGIVGKAQGEGRHDPLPFFFMKSLHDFM
jgi:hypothetical protein